MIIEISIAVIILGFLQFLITLWISERLKASLQKENAAYIEKLRWDIKVREQAARVAEYLSIASRLTENDSPELYRIANRLSWELAMWLPDDLYKSMIYAIAQPNEKNNPLSVIVEIRKYLIGEKASGNLAQNDIGHHSPGIGKKNKQ